MKSENYGYRVIDLADAGYAGWKTMERMKTEGFCIPGNASAMATVTRTILAKLAERESERDVAALREGRIALVSQLDHVFLACDGCALCGAIQAFDAAVHHSSAEDGGS